MLKTVFKNLITDLRIIASSKELFYASYSPFILLLLLRIIQPEASLYTLSAITVISSIPIVVGALIGYIHTGESYIGSNLKKDSLNTAFSRIIEILILSFILCALAAFLFNPVQSEGWLRTVYVCTLFSLQSVQIFLLLLLTSAKGSKPLIAYFVNIFFLVAIPAGLLLQSPWNILFFLSPQYWISWAWVTSDLTESIISGMISILFIIIPVLFWFKRIKE